MNNTHNTQVATYYPDENVYMPEDTDTTTPNSTVVATYYSDENVYMPEYTD